MAGVFLGPGSGFDANLQEWKRTQESSNIDDRTEHKHLRPSIQHALPHGWRFFNNMLLQYVLHQFYFIGHSYDTFLINDTYKLLNDILDDQWLLRDRHSVICSCVVPEVSERQTAVPGLPSL